MFGGKSITVKSVAIRAFIDAFNAEAEKTGEPPKQVLVIDSCSYIYDESERIRSLRDAFNGLHEIKQVSAPTKTNSRNPMHEAGAQPWKKRGKGRR